MKNTAFLFPGQGSQSIGMMSGLAADFPVVEATFAEASAVLGYDLWRVCQDGPEDRLNRTDVTQPAMLAAGVATWRVWLQSGGSLPGWMAGHSLGEYSALVAAGVLQFGDAMVTVAERGKRMRDATPESGGAMAAILGLEESELVAICAEQAGDQTVSCANFNAPGQVVIAGDTAAVERVCAAALDAGARRALRLPVSAPCHCALMKPAAAALARRLDAMQFTDASVHVVQNTDVTLHDDADSIRDALSRQLWQPVRWTDTIRLMLERGVTRFVECGPGKVLSGLNRRISRASEVVALTDGEAVAGLLRDEGLT